MVSFIDQQLQEIEGQNKKDTVLIEALKKQRETENLQGFAKRRKIAQINEVSDRISKRSVRQSVLSNLRNEISGLQQRGLSVSDQEAKNVFESRISGVESSLRAQRVSESNQKAQNLLLRKEAQRQGLTPVRIRGVLRFKDNRTGNFVPVKSNRVQQVKVKTLELSSSKRSPKRARVIIGKKTTTPKKSVEQQREELIERRGGFQNVLTAPQKQKGLRGVSQTLKTKREIKRTELQRDKGKFKPKREGELALLTAGQLVTDTAIGVGSLLKAIPKAPKSVINAIKNPKATGKTIVSVGKSVPTAIKGEGERIGRLAKISPTEALVEVGGQILLLKGSGKAFQVVGKVTPKVRVKVSPKLQKVKGSNVVLVGTQKSSGDKIVTDIAFKTDKGRVGVARGLTVQKGKDSVTFTVGKSATPKTSKLTGKKKLVEKETFIGVERGVSKPGIVKDVREVEGVGKVIRNLEGINQASFGKTAQARGNKILRKGTINQRGRVKARPVRDLKVKDFVSISSVLTKKDLSLIAGKTLTSEKDLINFLGLIKGVKNVDRVFETLPAGKQTLYKKALQDVVSTVSASSPKAQRLVPKLSSKVRIQISKKVLTKSSRQKLKARSRRQATGLLAGTKTVQAVRRAQASKSRSRVAVRSRQKLRTATSTKQRLKQKTSPATRQRAKQLTAQKSATKTKKKAIAKTKGLTGRGIGIRTAKRTPGVLGKRLKKSKRATSRKTGKIGYNVFGKHKGKLIKLNAKPLTKRDALSRGSFAIDKSTARTFQIKQAGKVKDFGKIKKKERNYIKKAKPKVRSFRVVKGKRVRLKNKFIEKGKFAIDSRGEKRQLSLARLVKREGFGVKRKVSRKKSRTRIRTRKLVRSKPMRRKPVRVNKKVMSRVKRSGKRVTLSKKRNKGRGYQVNVGGKILREFKLKSRAEQFKDQLQKSRRSR